MTPCVIQGYDCGVRSLMPRDPRTRRAIDTKIDIPFSSPWITSSMHGHPLITGNLNETIFDTCKRIPFLRSPIAVRTTSRTSRPRRASTRPQFSCSIPIATLTATPLSSLRSHLSVTCRAWLGSLLIINGFGIPHLNHILYYQRPTYRSCRNIYAILILAGAC
jgi:hypothetical protein